MFLIINTKKNTILFIYIIVDKARKRVDTCKAVNLDNFKLATGSPAGSRRNTTLKYLFFEKKNFFCKTNQLSFVIEVHEFKVVIHHHVHHR